MSQVPPAVAQWHRAGGRTWPQPSPIASVLSARERLELEVLCLPSGQCSTFKACVDRTEQQQTSFTSFLKAFTSKFTETTVGPLLSVWGNKPVTCSKSTSVRRSPNSSERMEAEDGYLLRQVSTLQSPPPHTFFGGGVAVVIFCSF